jgi:hypothetical protein
VLSGNQKTSALNTASQSSGSAGASASPLSTAEDSQQNADPYEDISDINVRGVYDRLEIQYENTKEHSVYTRLDKH